MSPPVFTITPHDEGVVCLQIATDPAPYLGAEWVVDFCRALERVAADAAVRVVVLEGGTRYFSAGASREALVHPGRDDAITTYAGRVAEALLLLPVPVIAAAAGHAVGGGLLLALWCDVAVLADDSLYGANFMALGFTPGMGATVAVEEAFGPALGRELLYTGRLMTGREIRDAACPLSHAVHARAQVLEQALRIARHMAEAPRPAIVLLKAALASRRRAALDRALAVEQANHAQLFQDETIRTGIAYRYATRPMTDTGQAP